MNDMISRDEAILIVQDLLRDLRGDIEIIGEPSVADRAYARLSDLLEHLVATDTETPVQRVLFWCAPGQKPSILPELARWLAENRTQLPLGHTPGEAE